ncbi:MAG TPA: hypothetical protein VMK12_23070 [Anaeromyxobacteraceae bacterium]|nr:hypothetical protein [Anaeromyxobacteraceae bacterium]
MSARHVLALVFSTAIFFAQLAPAPLALADAPPGNSLSSAETNWKGVVAEVTEFRRRRNTLTVKIRLTNRSGPTCWPSIEIKHCHLIDSDGRKKYEALKDEIGNYIASADSSWSDSLDPSGSKTFWVKFPAPPPEVKAITLQIPGMPPFEDLAIQD